MPGWGRGHWLVASIAAGIPLGLGSSTFLYAGGASYLSNDPGACANCHIMRRELDDWQKASHHTAATCVDCHLPSALVPRYAAKGLNGFNHSKAFTLGDFPEPIRITPRNAAILQDNCLRCHAPLVHELAASASGDGDESRCVRCHASVGHGELLGLGAPDRGERAELAGVEDPS